MVLLLLLVLMNHSEFEEPDGSVEKSFGFISSFGFGEVVDLDELKGGESRPSGLTALSKSASRRTLRVLEKDVVLLLPQVWRPSASRRTLRVLLLPRV
jgi:hypothetical protein